MEVTLNMTKTECIRQSNDWGGTTYHDLCSGDSMTVPWGFMDYVGGLAFLTWPILALVMFAIVILIIKLGVEA